MIEVLIIAAALGCFSSIAMVSSLTMGALRAASPRMMHFTSLLNCPCHFPCIIPQNQVRS